MNVINESVWWLLNRRLYILSFYLFASVVLSSALYVAQLHAFPIRMSILLATLAILPLNLYWFGTVLFAKAFVKAVIRFFIEGMVDAIRVLDEPLQGTIIRTSLTSAAVAILMGGGMVLAATTAIVRVIMSHEDEPTLAVSGMVMLLEAFTLLTAIATPLVAWWVFRSLRHFTPHHRPGLPEYNYRARCYTYASETLENVAHEKEISLVHAAGR